MPLRGNLWTAMADDEAFITTHGGRKESDPRGYGGPSPTLKADLPICSLAKICQSGRKRRSPPKNELAFTFFVFVFVEASVYPPKKRRREDKRLFFLAGTDNLLQGCKETIL
ncbi:hypothetical protein HY732_03905 [Candidatus Uhrbacteria bacterium]|nr:hypothetical protein [Candidatus Uhrbacteria bacterium]